MRAQTAEVKSTPAVFLNHWVQVNEKLAALAEAIPESQYETAPVSGVRTIGDVLRHVAFWNQFVADSAGGKETDESANELPKTGYTKKSVLVDALRRTAKEAGAALQNTTGPNEKALETMVTFLEHTSEHYGQLVVYARLTGIVPPASRV